jgi:hypothetical protein
MTTENDVTFGQIVFFTVVMGFITWHFFWGVFGLYPGLCGGGYAFAAYLVNVMFYLYLVGNFLESSSRRMEAKEKECQLQVQLSRQRDADKLSRSRRRDGSLANNFWKGETHEKRN